MTGLGLHPANGMVLGLATAAAATAGSHLTVVELVIAGAGALAAVTSAAAAIYAVVTRGKDRVLILTPEQAEALRIAELPSRRRRRHRAP